ncbi:DNA polymerase III subunit beta [bacterium]|nr:DNA polymerase III subunit beta [bacterium]MBU1884578.1 DNA polymerase III subunit beta [bacterium]
MKITIAKSILENILISSQPFLEKKDTSQITSHVYIKVQNSVLTLKATDYEIGLHVTIDQINSIEDGEVTANGKKLLDIIRILKDSDITLETKNDMLHISQASSNFKLPTFLSNEFPLFPNYEGKPKISIDSHTLIESLKKITPAIDSNNPKFELNGALIDIKNDNIAFVSTDTRRLALVNIENSTQNTLSIIIPKKAIIEIQKLFFDNIEIYYDNTYLIIHSNQYTFYTKLINGKFPDYSRIIPKEISKTILLPKSIIIDSIKQITTISNDMKVTLHNNKIMFESLSNDNIEAKTEITHTTGFDEPFILAVNSRYILDFLAQIDNQEFTLGLNDSNLPFILTDDNFKTIVMPIVI